MATDLKSSHQFSTIGKVYGPIPCEMLNARSDDVCDFVIQAIAQGWVQHWRKGASINILLKAGSFRQVYPTIRSLPPIYFFPL